MNFRPQRLIMGLLGGLYRGVFKRTSTFTAAICIGAIGVSLVSVLEYSILS